MRGPVSGRAARPHRCPAKISLRMIAWMPQLPSTTWVTPKSTATEPWFGCRMCFDASRGRGGPGVREGCGLDRRARLLEVAAIARDESTPPPDTYDACTREWITSDDAFARILAVRGTANERWRSTRNGSSTVNVCPTYRSSTSDWWRVLSFIRRSRMLLDEHSEWRERPDGHQVEGQKVRLA